MKVVVLERDDWEYNTFKYPVGRYIKEYYDPAKYYAQRIKENYAKYPINLIATGSSGCILASLIAAYLNWKHLEIYYVPKSEEVHTHQRTSDECEKLKQRFDYLTFIVDDFINTGETVNRMIKRLMDCDIYNYNLILFDHTSRHDIDSLDEYPEELWCLKEFSYPETFKPREIEKIDVNSTPESSIESSQGVTAEQ